MLGGIRSNQWDCLRFLCFNIIIPAAPRTVRTNQITTAIKGMLYKTGIKEISTTNIKIPAPIGTISKNVYNLRANE